MSFPTTMKAVVENASETGIAIEDVPVPALGKGDILVKVEYVSQNPTDWKHAAYMSTAGSIMGCDFAGTVVGVSGDVTHERTHIKAGARVAGVVHGGKYPDRGSFAQYLVTPADLAWVVPDNVKLEDAATFGVPFNTAIHALVQSQNKPFPPAKEKGWMFIYGGSSGVGLFALQVAKLMGYKVVTVASPHSFDLVKKYGADEVFDYHDGDAAIQSVLKVTGGGVHLGFDTISIEASNLFSVQCFAPEGGQLNVLLPGSAKATELRPDVKLAFTLLYTWQGKQFSFGPRHQQQMDFPASKEDLEMHRQTVAKTAELVSIFGIHAPPIVLRGGLKDIEAGFEEMKEGKISGKRLVYKVD